MSSKYKALATVAGLVVLLFLPLVSAQEQQALTPLAKLDLGGSKVNGFVFTTDGKHVFVSTSVGRESSVFLVGASTADVTKFYGKKRAAALSPEKSA